MERRLCRAVHRRRCHGDKREAGTDIDDRRPCGRPEVTGKQARKMDGGFEVDRDLMMDVGPGLLLEEAEPPLYPRVIDKHVQPGICFRGPAMEIRPFIHVGDVARTQYEGGVFLFRLPEGILAAPADDDRIPVPDELAGEPEPYPRPS